MKATSKVERYYFSAVVPQKTPLNGTFIMVCFEAFWRKERENKGAGLYGKDANAWQVRWTKIYVICLSKDSSMSFVVRKAPRSSICLNVKSLFLDRFLQKR